MITDTSKKIMGYIRLKKQARVRELVDYLNFSHQAVSNQLRRLVKEGRLAKIGRPPKVFYFLAEKKEKLALTLPKPLNQVLQDHFLLITPAGEMKEGAEGFVLWCGARNLPLEKTAMEYSRTLRKYHAFSKNDFIDGMPKMKNTFNRVFLDHLYYLDFYSIERFGKTRLGQMLLYAKQSQNRGFIKTLIFSLKPAIEKLIKKHQIDAVGFIPPTVKREVQFMKELEKHLNLPVPVLKITKVKTPIIVPQKTLNKLSDRVENASRTIVAEESRFFRHILLVDDAVGSGASMNETVRQFKEKKIAKKVTGLAITGSFKGFDVISEV